MPTLIKLSLSYIEAHYSVFHRLSNHALYRSIVAAVFLKDSHLLHQLLTAVGEEPDDVCNGDESDCYGAIDYALKLEEASVMPDAHELRDFEEVRIRLCLCTHLPLVTMFDDIVAIILSCFDARCLMHIYIPFIFRSTIWRNLPCKLVVGQSCKKFFTPLECHLQM
jgi:hypothetical protein